MISAASPSTGPSGAVWRGSPQIKGSSEAMRMIVMTSCLIGIQFTWGIEMTYCTPYLLSLGLSKSTISLVWLAGPLSGLIVQPLVGVLADQSTSRFGRRRPFMVFGAVVTVLALLLLGWTKECVAALWAGSEAGITRVALWVAVGSIYVIDFAINAVMASARSLFVDTLPLSKQQAGSAWASRMAAVGHVIAYAAGAVDLENTFGDAIGDSQFKRLIVVSAVALIFGVVVTCIGVEERILVARDGKDERDGGSIGIVAVVSKFGETLRTLPVRISALCWVTFWCWIGWFPFLFYSTTWIGEIYLHYEVPSLQTDETVDAVGQVGRVGSMALVTFSFVTMIGSIVLPWIISSPEESDDFTRRPPQRVAGALMALHKYRPSLQTAWVYSIFMFSACMMCAPFVSSLRAATFIVAICGVPWAVQCWAPFTFLGIEVNRLATPTSSSTSKTRSSRDLQTRPSPLDLEKAAALSSTSQSSGANSSDLAGAYLGILNLYTTLPQFIGSFISCAVFAILDPAKESTAAHGQISTKKPSSGPNAIAVCLFIGGLAALMATRQAKRLRVDS